MVWADSHEIPRAPRYSGTPLKPHPVVNHLHDYHALRYSIPTVSTQPQDTVLATAATNKQTPQHRTRNPCRVSHAHGLAIIRFRSPLLTEYLLLQVLRCFTSLRIPPRTYQFSTQQPDTTRARFPHSETPGSTLTRQLPGAIVDRNVLHRHLVPRHPPNAHTNEHNKPKTNKKNKLAKSINKDTHTHYPTHKHPTHTHNHQHQPASAVTSKARTTTPNGVLFLHPTACQASITRSTPTTHTRARLKRGLVVLTKKFSLERR